MNYIIGIDSGGTKSELKAYDFNDNVIYESVGGYGNPAVNLEETIANVCYIIDECLKILGIDDCMLIGIGMAAVEMSDYAYVIRNYIETTFEIETIVINDAEMACKAYLGRKDGIVAIAGTGSSCYVQQHGRGEIVGGWSHILGDEGSGYHTVIEAFKNITYEFDRDVPYDCLSSKLLEQIGGSSRSDIMKFIYSSQKNKIASLFPIIVETARYNNPDAILLLENAGRFLAETTVTAYRKKNFENEITIGLKGGVFKHSSVVLSSYKYEIKKRISNFVLIEDDISSTKGVCNIFHNR